MYVRNNYDMPVMLAEQRLYGVDPVGLGSRSKGEWANQIVGEYFTQGVVKQMAGALEAADAFIAKAKEAGLAGRWRLGVLPAAGVGIAAIKIAPIALNISSILKGIASSKRANRVAKNSKAGKKRAEKNYLQPSVKLYQQLAEALAAVGVQPPSKASDAYYQELLTRIKYRKYKRSLGKRSQRTPYGRFMDEMKNKAATIRAILAKAKESQATAKVDSGPVEVLSPSTSPEPVSKTEATPAPVMATPSAAPQGVAVTVHAPAAAATPAATPAAGEEEKKTNPLTVAGLTFLALKLFGG